MITRKFLASAVVTIATAGAIGIAIAQTTSPSMPNSGGPNSTAENKAATDSNAGTTTGSTSSTTGSSATMNSQSSGAGSTLSAEAAPRADRN